jgi:hypothetical protein
VPDGLLGGIENLVEKPADYKNDVLGPQDGQPALVAESNNFRKRWHAASMLKASSLFLFTPRRRV